MDKITVIESIVFSGIDRDYKISLQSNKQKKHIAISVRKGDKEKNIIIIEDDFPSFLNAINKITKYKSYNVEEIRQRHKKAYEKWTNEDDEKLELLYCEKKTIKEIANVFGRQQNAIKARIKKLELKQKYE